MAQIVAGVTQRDEEKMDMEGPGLYARTLTCMSSVEFPEPGGRVARLGRAPDGLSDAPEPTSMCCSVGRRAAPSCCASEAVARICLKEATKSIESRPSSRRTLSRS